VIASGEQHSVRDFVNAAAEELNMEIEWRGEGLDETGTVASAEQSELVGKVIVRVDPRYFRPTEVESLLGDPSRAKEKLGWTPKTSFKELVAEMVRYDLEEAKRDRLCSREGFTVKDHFE
jgi:GDPmannose 4,6-dehydratase